MADRGVSVGKAYVQIMPSTEGIAKGIKDELNGGADPTGKSFGGKLGGAIKKALLGAGIGVALKKAIGEGASLEQSIGGVETLYKESADALIKNADRAWKTAGVSANTYMEQATSFSASLLSSLGGDTEKAVKLTDMAISDMSDNANKFGTDIQMIQSAYAGFSRNNFTMLDNLKLGFAGSKEGMEALLQRAEEISGIHYDISSLADMYEAIHVVQQELGVTGTTALEGEKTISGSLMAMQSAFQNFMGNLTLGRNIDESMKALVESTSTFLFKNLIPAVGRVFTSLPKAMGSFVLEGLPSLLSSFVILFNQLASSIDLSGDFVGKIMSGLTTLSSTLLGYSGMFVDAGLRLIQNLVTGLMNGLPAFIQNAPIIIGNLADIINQNAPKIMVAGVNIMKSIAIGLVKAIPTLVASIPSIISALFKVWQAWNWMNLGKLAMTKIKNGVTSGATTVINAVKGLITKLKSYFPFNVGKIFSNIKLPKFTVTGKMPYGLGGKGVAPSFGIKWNAEGGIFDTASIIGLGVGERGSELVMPLDSFWSRLETTLGDAKVNTTSAPTSSGIINMVINFDGEPVYKNTVNWINGQTLQFGVSPLTI